MLGLFGCAPLVIAGYVAMPILLDAQDASTIAAARWYLLIAFGYVFAGIPHAVLRGIGDFAWWNALRLVPTAVWVAALGAALLLNRADPQFIAGANLLLMSLVAVPIMLVTIMYRVPPPYAPAPGDWRPMVGFGVPSALTTVPSMLNFRLDQMLMAAILPAEMLGLYLVAVVWSLSLSPCLGAVATTLFPHVASHAGSERQRRAFIDVVKLSGAAALLAAAGLALMTPWILPLVFGPEFAPSVPAALTLVLAAAALGFNQVLEEGLRGLGRPTAVLWSEVVGLAISVVLLVLLLRPLGIIGAALASLCGYASVTALLLRSARDIIGLPLSEIIIPRRRELRAGWKWILASH
jgi:O-antigen/teichoic acid export membrane protein